MDVLEQAITDLRQQRAADNSKLDSILAAMVVLTGQKETAETQKKEDTPKPSPAGTRQCRPATPQNFDGDRSKGMTFLNACQTYFRLAPDEFADDETKIIWAMSYMNSGRAQKWTARVFLWEQMPEHAGLTRFRNWDDFRTEFKAEFTPAHADALAINRLESAAYYQRSRTLDEYLDEFQDLTTEAGYTDPKTIVVKFRRGLNPPVQNAVATMAAGRPSDSDPQAWYDAARVVEQNRAANEAFNSAHRPAAPVTTRLPVLQLDRPTARTAPAYPAPAPGPRQAYAHLTPSPGNPVPMDLDAARRKAGNSLLCYRCKAPDHLSRDCPTRFDVRTLTTDELQEILEGRLAQLDVVSEESPSEEKAESQKLEDFPTSSE